MKISELRKKILRQSSTVQRIYAEKHTPYSLPQKHTDDMNANTDTFFYADSQHHREESIYQRFFLNDNEKKLLHDIYLSDFDELIDFDE